jgi:uncharacterized protein YjbI with pentapeptide repeats
MRELAFKRLTAKAGKVLANPEHVEIVKQGPKSIEAWRRGNPWSRLNLEGAMLAGAELIGADLRAAILLESDLSDSNLTDADLSNAYLGHATLTNANLRKCQLVSASLVGTYAEECDLSEAILDWADLKEINLQGAVLTNASLALTTLYGAHLSGANFSNANLSRASFVEADLSRAILRSARLSDVNLTGAYLPGTDFAEATIQGVIFADTDLSLSLGLKETIHLGPSSISVDTLYNSRGLIPEAFLRGCGLPDVLIAYLPSLISAMEPIQYQSCFISYSTKDDEFARRLHDKMRGKGLRVWFAPEDMEGGKKIVEQVDRAIQVNDRLLLVFSEHSLKSAWVRAELLKARKAERLEHRQKLFPIRLVDLKKLEKWQCVDFETGENVAAEVLSYHIPDFSNWKDHDAFEAAFKRLMDDLKKASEPK